MPYLVSTVADFAKRGIGFQSITEAMDTTTAGGELLFHVMGALAQFERRLNAERSRAEIEAARRRYQTDNPYRIYSDYVAGWRSLASWGLCNAGLSPAAKRCRVSGTL